MMHSYHIKTITHNSIQFSKTSVERDEIQNVGVSGPNLLDIDGFNYSNMENAYQVLA